MLSSKNVPYIAASLLFLNPMLTLQGLTTFIPRSQGENTAREMVGWQRQLYKNYDENYAVTALTVEYERSFGTECIAEKFFSTDCLSFQGSQVENRDPNAIVADYFGLPTDFKGTLAIKPLIQNIIIDLNMYFGLDAWSRGLYLRVHAPVTHTRWTLGLDDCVVCDGKFRGCTQFPDCYMYSNNMIFNPEECPIIPNEKRDGPDCPANPFLNPPPELANENCTTQSIREALSGRFTFGDMTDQWEFGKFSFCPRSKTGIPDIDVIMGYNLIHTDFAHAGFFGVTVIPTGNRPKGRYVFEPLLGDGRHWKLGGGFSGHISLYDDLNFKDFNMGVYVRGRLVKAFSTDQIRSFDFIDNGLLSRYILLKEYHTDNNYNGNMVNAINFATRNCEVSVGLVADISTKIFFGARGWDMDIGYNFFYRQEETVCIKTECPCPIDQKLLAIKGLEGVCCTLYAVDGDIATPEVLGNDFLNADQPNATMFTPELPTSAEPGQGVTAVCLSWNSKPITEDTPVDQLVQDGFILADTTEGPPPYITCADLDPSSAAQGRMVTHKLFGHLNYTFDSCHTPFIGIGAEGEFDACNNNALQHWGIWLKLGAAF